METSQDSFGFLLFSETNSKTDYQIEKNTSFSITNRDSFFYPLFYNINSSSHENTIIPQNMFVTKKPMKRHSKYTYDNIMNRIKVFFVSSIITYINEVIRAFFTHQRFRIRKITNSLVSCKSYNINKEFYQKSLHDYFSEEISKKYFLIHRNQNTKNIEKLIHYNFFQQLLELTLLQVFSKMFIEERGIESLITLKVLNLKQKESILNIKMKTLKDFEEVLAKRKYDEKYIDKIRQVCLNIAKM